RNSPDFRNSGEFRYDSGAFRCSWLILQSQAVEDDVESPAQLLAPRIGGAAGALGHFGPGQTLRPQVRDLSVMGLHAGATRGEPGANGDANERPVVADDRFRRVHVTGAQTLQQLRK